MVYAVSSVILIAALFMVFRPYQNLNMWDLKPPESVVEYSSSSTQPQPLTITLPITVMVRTESNIIPYVSRSRMI